VQTIRDPQRFSPGDGAGRRARCGVVVVRRARAGRDSQRLFAVWPGHSGALPAAGMARSLWPALSTVMPEAASNDVPVRRTFERLEQSMDDWCAEAKFAV
jgi:hypothetical protein